MILFAQAVGIATGIGAGVGISICLLYTKYRLYSDEQEYQRMREGDRLIIDFMKKEHERRMEHMRFMQEMQRQQ